MLAYIHENLTKFVLIISHLANFSMMMMMMMYATVTATTLRRLDGLSKVIEVTVT